MTSLFRDRGETFDWTFKFHADDALYVASAETYEEALAKVRDMKPGDAIPKMVSQDLSRPMRVGYEHPRESEVDTDEENYLSSGWSGRERDEDS